MAQHHLHTRSSAVRRVALLSVFFGVLLGAGGTALVAEVGGSAYFSDVPTGAYFRDAVQKLYEANIMRGVNGRFNPGALVTRAELAVSLQRLREEFYGGAASPSQATRSRPRPVMEEPRASSASSASSSSSSSSSPSSSSTPRITGPTVRFTIGKFTVKEDKQQAQISVIRTGGNREEVSVSYALGGGSATAGEDYVPVTGTLTFAAGETAKVFTCEVMNDETVEGNETVDITLKEPSGITLGMPSTATLVIADDDGLSATAVSAAPTVSSLSFSAYAYEVAENGVSVTIAVLRSGPTTGAASVSYATSNGTARSSEYTAASGVLSFASGESTKTFTVSVADDGNIEGNKTVKLTLSAPTGGATLGTPSSALLTLVDNELASSAPAFRFKTSSFEASEGAVVTVLVQHLGVGTAASTVEYRTSDGSAREGQDYSATSGTLTFLPGEAEKSFSVPILKDAASDPDEKINLGISAPTGGPAIGTPDAATITIYE